FDPSQFHPSQILPNPSSSSTPPRKLLPTAYPLRFVLPHRHLSVAVRQRIRTGANSARAGAEAGATPPIRSGDVASSVGDCTESDEEAGDTEFGEGEGDSSGDELGERHRGFPSLLHQWKKILEIRTPEDLVEVQVPLLAAAAADSGEGIGRS
ncbi:hypothetical protein LINPERPRIM_LOCUS4252, partial [Linum perenne]